MCYSKRLRGERNCRGLRELRFLWILKKDKSTGQVGADRLNELRLQDLSARTGEPIVALGAPIEKLVTSKNFCCSSTHFVFKKAFSVPGPEPRLYPATCDRRGVQQADGKKQSRRNNKIIPPRTVGPHTHVADLCQWQSLKAELIQKQGFCQPQKSPCRQLQGYTRLNTRR